MEQKGLHSDRLAGICTRFHGVLPHGTNGFYFVIYDNRFQVGCQGDCAKFTDPSFRRAGQRWRNVSLRVPVPENMPHSRAKSQAPDCGIFLWAWGGTYKKVVLFCNSVHPEIFSRKVLKSGISFGNM